MAMLKSFALTLDRPLYGLSSLDAIARTAVAPFCVTAACIDARRGEIYASFYREVDGRCEQITDELLLRPEAFGELTLKMFPDMPIFCIGTAFPHYGDCLTKINPSLCCRYAAPSAASLGLNMVEAYEDKLPDQSLESLEPLHSHRRFCDATAVRFFNAWSVSEIERVLGGNGGCEKSAFCRIWVAFSGRSWPRRVEARKMGDFEVKIF